MQHAQSLGRGSVAYLCSSRSQLVCEVSTVSQDVDCTIDVVYCGLRCDADCTIAVNFYALFGTRIAQQQLTSRVSRSRQGSCMVLVNSACSGSVRCSRTPRLAQRRLHWLPVRKASRLRLKRASRSIEYSPPPRRVCSRAGREGCKLGCGGVYCLSNGGRRWMNHRPSIASLPTRSAVGSVVPRVAPLALALALPLPLPLPLENSSFRPMPIDASEGTSLHRENAWEPCP